MKERRRHQRIRFDVPPRVRLGQFGVSGSGHIESLSLGGMMLQCELPLRVGAPVGCEFELFASPLIDLSALVVGHIGQRHSIRFVAGPVSACLIEEAVERGLAAGKASVLSINEVHGRRVMRVVGGLTARLHDDFMHGLTRMRVDRLDLAGVTQIDAAGVDLCGIAIEQYQAGIVRPSSCVRAVIAGRVAREAEETLQRDGDRNA